MNRRKAIFRISVAAAGAVVLTGGYNWYNIIKNPDISYLDQNKGLIAALAETIIPETDSPGAKKAGVHDFIVKLIRDCTTVREQNTFIDGLKSMNSFCMHKWGHSYDQCTVKEQEEALAHFEEIGMRGDDLVSKVKNRYLGRPFFTILKQSTVEGYCTSQPGATLGLAYAYIPGRFQGCIPLVPGQKAWATN
jgi:hypothetical protein